MCLENKFCSNSNAENNRSHSDQCLRETSTKTLKFSKCNYRVAKPHNNFLFLTNLNFLIVQM